ncbi:MAG: DUF2252 domain-containing protein [Solirubrobacteraceae bacterium]
MAHPSANGHAEPAALGRAARRGAPRSSHAEWQPDAHRPDPVATLEAQAETRVPELLPIRYGRMLESAFSFYRGAAAVMAADLATTPTSDIRTQLCGDAHLSNFGAFAAPDRSLVFDLNDFDETLPGPWEWDLKRLVASYAVAGRDRGFDAHERRPVALAATRAYREAMRQFATMRATDLWYLRLDLDGLIARWQSQVSARRRKVVARATAKARSRDSLKAFAKLTHVVDGQPRFRSDPPLLVPIRELLADDDERDLETELRRLLRDYGRSLAPHRRRLLDRYRPVDFARKVVGVGSVGMRAWVVLLLGPGDGDPLFLQVKEAGPSVLEPYAGPSRARTQGRRVVDGQLLMQAAADILLGHLRVSSGIDGEARDFYVRQLWDSKGSAEIELMDPTGMRIQAQICGWTLARAHARSGEPAAIAAYAGRGDALDRALAEFAETYADQNERDHAALARAAREGTITAGPALR